MSDKDHSQKAKLERKGAVYFKDEKKECRYTAEKENTLDRQILDHIKGLEQKLDTLVGLLEAILEDQGSMEGSSDQEDI